MSEFEGGNRIVIAHERERLHQPHNTLIRNLGSTIIRGLEQAVDTGVTLLAPQIRR